MPNLCENHTHILGPKEDIERLFAVLDTPNAEQPLINLYPMPLMDADNVREWSVSNWGTKWGDYDYFSDDIEIEDYEDGTAGVSLSYHTAWSPFDVTYWTKVSTDWPTLWFTTSYSEPGCCFVGAFSARDGVVENYETTDLPEWSGEPDDYPEWLDAVDQLRNECADVVDELIHRNTVDKIIEDV